jgi:hypothetical protein
MSNVLLARELERALKAKKNAHLLAKYFGVRGATSAICTLNPKDLRSADDAQALAEKEIGAES